MKLQEGDDDGELVSKARAETELKRLAKKAEEAEGLGLSRGNFLPPGVEPLGLVEYDEDVQLPPNVNPDISSEEASMDSSEEDDIEERRIVDVSLLRERLGFAEGLRFGKFLRVKPPKNSVVITVGEDYVGMAIVLEREEEGYEDKVLLQPMKVELFNGCITVKRVEDIDLVHAELDSLIYVSPDSRHWTRRRSKEVLQLLEDIDGWGHGSII
ncbi:hypothetical protein Pmar_PMAR001521 [Perkinsus marinus ATCC 50983]|uniref:Uncharacterized protein n=1 Tax=Perkinsus marinus (strain ATCC 50983 / TXsc) TaxID=423536 RepID=C5K6X5_PERM5|nr:hypothetical protein Pmar_PMAR001521 [Perkinsus marinus ATCC 50983]EER19768.1 hypothetical protein Pmar_PMAR001521 [Perkinsus marinus ATCC 50983]|eukprot:XP_002787972.1 hypothetical protein Pmar_PMAR001521 [Perkinsus marinus ATCC 50983]